MKKNKTKKLLIILFLLISVFLLIFFKIETDYFWHIKAGEYMFKNGILTHDVFSWFVNSKYWMSHEWLFEIILYSFKLFFGNYHPIIYCFITLLSLISIILIYNRNNLTKNVPYTLLYISSFTMIALCFIQARPHMISYSFIALTIYLLFDLYKNENSKKIYILPLITILWSNIHGGSSNLSYIFAFIFLFSGLFNIKLKKLETNKLTKKQIYKYILIIILCMISVCINIHGIKMFIYPYENIFDTTMIQNISEWRSTSFTNIYHYVYYIFLIIVMVFMLLSNKKLRLIDCLLFIATAFLGIKSIRFWLYCPIVMSFVIFDYFDERELDKGTNIVIITMIIVLFITSICYFKYNTKYEININKDIVNIIKRENPKRLYNMYDYGGELIYHNIPVFVDGRADLYSKYNLKDYLDISNCNGNYIELINKYNFDYMLVSKQYNIYNYIKYNLEYSILYENKNLVLYKKTVN